MEQKLVSARQLARMLGIGYRSIYPLWKSGKIRSYKIGRSRRFDPEEVMEDLKRKEATGEN